MLWIVTDIIGLLITFFYKRLFKFTYFPRKHLCFQYTAQDANSFNWDLRCLLSIYYRTELWNQQMKVVTHLFCFLACTDHGSVASYSRPHSTSLLMQRLQALATINRTLLKTGKGSFQSSHSRCQSLDVEEGKDDMSSFPTNEDSEHALCQVSIFKSMPTDNQSSVSDQASALEMLIKYPSSETQVVFSNFFYMVFVTASYIN